MTPARIIYIPNLNCGNLYIYIIILMTNNLVMHLSVNLIEIDTKEIALEILYLLILSIETWDLDILLHCRLISV